MAAETVLQRTSITMSNQWHACPFCCEVKSQTFAFPATVCEWRATNRATALNIDALTKKWSTGWSYWTLWYDLLYQRDLS